MAKHIFFVYIFSLLPLKTPLSLTSMWLSESVNDLFESGIQDDNLALIHAANAKNLVAVKTPAGITDRKSIEKIVMQGEVTGPGQCSNQVDTLGKECLEDENICMSIKVGWECPPLAWWMMLLLSVSVAWNQLR